MYQSAARTLTRAFGPSPKLENGFLIATHFNERQVVSTAPPFLTTEQTDQVGIMSNAHARFGVENHRCWPLYGEARPLR